jgi:hypothetical protein
MSRPNTRQMNLLRDCVVEAIVTKKGQAEVLERHAKDRCSQREIRRLHEEAAELEDLLDCVDELPFS